MTTMEHITPAWVFRRGKNSSKNHTGSPADARSVSNIVFALTQLVREKIQSRKLKSRNGARNLFQEPSLELSSQAT
jgi:hypothetical protein